MPSSSFQPNGNSNSISRYKIFKKLNFQNPNQNHFTCNNENTNTWSVYVLSMVHSSRQYIDEKHADDDDDDKLVPDDG